MGLPRDLLVEMLQAPGHIPADVQVMPYARKVEAFSKQTVMVRVDEARPSPSGMGLRDYTFALVLVTPKTTAGPADDELDALLEDVLHALDSEDIPNAVTWESATRATYEESNPAYEVTVRVTVSKEQ